MAAERMLSLPLKELFITEEEDGIILSVYVQARSKRLHLERIREGGLKISLTASPLKGKANQQLISFLAKLLKMKKSAIKIVSGERARIKRVKINGITSKEVLDKLIPQLIE